MIQRTRFGAIAFALVAFAACDSSHGGKAGGAGGGTELTRGDMGGMGGGRAGTFGFGGSAAPAGGSPGVGGTAGSGGGGFAGGGSGPAGAPGAAGAPAGAGGAPGAPGTTPPITCAPGVLLEGPQALVAIFAVDEGVIAVRSDAVLLVGRDKTIIKTVPFGRQITAAAFDGSTLVVADNAALTVLDRTLSGDATVFVTETCVSGVLVSGKRFVCGPANDWDRLFYTYDVAAVPPRQIAVSDPYTYHGRPMRRVPGTDDFVTVTTDLSPSDFYLYRVGVDGKVVFQNESPYHGDFAATTTFAFDGSPAAHLIQVAGLMLKIYGTGCDSTTNSFTSGCFIKDGVLGTLRSGESYLGLADDGAGTVFGIVGSNGAASVFDAPCKGGCAVQRIDVAARTIKSQKVHAFDSQSLYSNTLVVPDPRCPNVIVGTTLPDPSDVLGSKGFQLQSLDY